MSFVIPANLILAQSHRLRKLLDGKFEVEVLPTPAQAPATTPYLFTLSSKTIQVAFDAALAENPYLSADLDIERESSLWGILKMWSARILQSTLS